MAVQILGGVKNGVQLKYGNQYSQMITRTISGVNVADTITNNPAVAFNEGGYTISGVYNFARLVKALVGTTSMAISLVQTRKIDNFG